MIWYCIKIYIKLIYCTLLEDQDQFKINIKIRKQKLIEIYSLSYKQLKFTLNKRKMRQQNNDIKW